MLSSTLGETSSFHFFDITTPTEQLTFTGDPSEAAQGTLPSARLSSVTRLEDALFPQGHPRFRGHPSGASADNTDFADDISALSEHTSRMGFRPAPAPSPPKKKRAAPGADQTITRKRHASIPRSTVAITVPIKATPEAILAGLRASCERSNVLPPDPPPDITFTSLLSPADSERAYLRFTTSLTAAKTSAMIHKTDASDDDSGNPKAEPKIFDAPPAEPTVNDLDRDGVNINNCRIVGCEHWNNQSDVPSWGTSTLAAHEHGVKFHHDFLLSLPDDVLRSIQWFRCSGCKQLFFSKNLLNDHENECPELKQAAGPRHLTTPYASIVGTCPPDKVSALIQMIDEPDTPPNAEYFEYLVWKWSKNNVTAGIHDNP